MYCIGCGVDNIESSLRCINCGHDLTTLRTDKYTWSEVATSSPILWNPDVAALLSILFSPTFGAVIHALNWRRLGQPRRALVSWLWAVFLFLAFFGLVIAHGAGVVATQLGVYDIDACLRLLQMVVLPLWYFAAARAQGKHVMQQLRGQYIRESWLIPVIAAFLLIGSIYGLTGALQ